MTKLKTKCFQELYCPNPSCGYHSIGSPQLPQLYKNGLTEKFHRFGTFKVKKSKNSAHKLQRQRFRCTLCRKTFSESFCTLEYRFQRRGFSPKVFELFARGLPNRQIAATLKLSETAVRCRLKLMAKQSLLIHTAKTRKLKIHESIAYDGVQNFARSQFEPNNINQAIGMKSLFIYDFNFSPLNRTGFMSVQQELRKVELEKGFGRFPIDAPRFATKNMLLGLLARCPNGRRLGFATDQHYQYKQAIELDLKPLKKDNIDHVTISSLRPRVFRHILHSVNHTDNLLRHHVKAFARETISFSKRHIAMIDKYALFLTFKNYIRTQFTKTQKGNHKANLQTPAMAVGLEKARLTFRNFFKIRLQKSHVILSQEWSAYFDGLTLYSRCDALKTKGPVNSSERTVRHL